MTWFGEAKWQGYRHGRAWLNSWDLLALLLALSFIFLLARGSQDMVQPYRFGDTLPISLGYQHLPYYAFRTAVRMLVAMCFSLVVSFTVGYVAAKSRAWERVIIPLVDVLQSLPVLGFLSISVWAFVALFPNSMLGPECAAIFSIFTAQIWNMLLGMYQNIKTLPADMVQLADVYQLSRWQRFWRIELPYAMPSLLWNMMISMSAGWFFVVASEAISLAKQTVLLPGIGSYIAVAVDNNDGIAIWMAMAAMLVVILLCHYLLFMPMDYWAEKFRGGFDPQHAPSKPFIVQIFTRARLVNHGRRVISLCASWWRHGAGHRFLSRLLPAPQGRWLAPKWHRDHASLWLRGFNGASWIGFGGVMLWLLFSVYTKLLPQVTGAMLLKTGYLGFLTGIRVLVMIGIAMAIWLPVGVWIGQRPRVASKLQPIIQFISAFPANLIYPLLAAWIITHQLNINIWASPLIVLGTQWYILFNVIAGTLSMPRYMDDISGLLHLGYWRRWRYVILPAIFPYLITGCLTAAGGAWNASIVAEVLDWNHRSFYASGLGAYIVAATRSGDYTGLALGVAVMCLYVIAMNMMLWQPLYRLATSRFRRE